MKEHKILNDICRCNGEDCDKKDDCLRYICRLQGGPWTTMASKLSNPDGTCDYKITPNKGPE